MNKPKPKIKIDTYLIVSEAVESGLQFALNRLEDVCQIALTDEQRRAAIPQMHNEIMLALDEKVKWD